MITKEINSININYKKGAISPLRITCSSELRQELWNRFPKLAYNKKYWPFLCYLLFHANYTVEGEIIAGAKIVSKTIGDEHKYRANNFRLYNFLYKFKANILPRMEWRMWKAKEKVTTITKLGLPTDLAEMIQNEKARPVSHMKERVYLDTGQSYSVSRSKRHTDKIREEAWYNSLSIEHPAQKKLLQYVNQLPSNRFQKMKSNVAEAYSVAGDIDQESKRDAAFNCLRAFEESPQPFYGPSGQGRTHRIFQQHLGLCTMKKEVRQILLADTIEADLKSAQLAINAALWEVESVKDFLQQGGNIWSSLYEHVPGLSEIVPLNTAKRVFKGCLYALCYGMTRRGLSRAINDAWRGQLEVDVSKYWWSHPIISALYDARERAAAAVRSNGGAQDCFGEWVPYDASSGRTEGSVLAQLAQATELKLLLPVVELARTTNEFAIVLWLHDGMYLAFKNRNRKDRWLTRLQKTVRAEAESMDIPTALNVKNAPGHDVSAVACQAYNTV